MHFTKIFASAVALCASVSSAALTPAEITHNIQILTQKSQALQSPAQTISVINGPLILIGQGPFPTIIAGFTDLVSTALTDIEAMQDTAQITGAADSTAIANAFREFVRVHQVLLNILIGKAGLFQTVPFIGQPIAAVLRQVENVVDTIAFGLIDDVQKESASLNENALSLKGTITIAINSYDGLSLS
ncbi:UVI-1 protein [Rutstroemia sp. NJR-2017a BBW]|nr:UVI-1 protein [Rutstroemia sp. NJR-2017a BBW]